MNLSDTETIAHSLMADNEPKTIHPGSYFPTEHLPMTFVTISELEEIYAEMIARAKQKRRVPQGFRNISELNNNEACQSLLPVGVDGQTTASVAKNPRLFFAEIERLLNQQRYRFKAYHAITKIGKNGKERKIWLPCLRDQVVFRLLLKKLRIMDLVVENKKSMEVLVKGIVDELRKKSSYKVIRTDIKDFYPSVVPDKLLTALKPYFRSDEERCVFQLLTQALMNNPSRDHFTGLPLGLSISPILSEFYIAQTGLVKPYDNASVFRYADDLVIITDIEKESETYIQEIKNRLQPWGLSISDDKTKVYSDEEPILFIGVTFRKGGCASLGEDRIKKWESMVWSDIAKDFDSYRIAKAMGKSNMPKHKEIIRAGWKEAKRGSRSRYWRWKAFVEGVGGE